MAVKVFDTPDILGEKAAEHIAASINSAIKETGGARIVLSTGASQFCMFKPLVKQDVDWSKVEMFHLDEYVGITEEHKASFRKYLKEKFTQVVPLKAAYFVNGEGDAAENIKWLSGELAKKPVDLGVIGIGENSHIAFNDPPADFETEESYIIVNLDDDCKRQQVREGWFPTMDDVPKQAISMSPHRIMRCREIVSVVPYEVKAKAVKWTLEQDVSPRYPATLLKTHPAWTLYLDRDSASLVTL